VAVDANLKAFLWGRRLAHDRAAVERFARPAAVVELPRTPTLDDLVARRAAYLTDYQDAAYAGRYRALVEQGARRGGADSARRGSPKPLARNYFKLLAVKDEYEVARLHADPAFQAKIAAIFEGDYTPQLPSGAAAAGENRSRHRSAEEARLRAMDADGLRAGWRS
jgi:indolepyruvate ferredoxin oxidoreductase